MNRTFQILIGFLIAFNLSACCASKKTAPPPAKEVLTDRNTRDPKLDNNPPKVELKDSI